MQPERQKLTPQQIIRMEDGLSLYAILGAKPGCDLEELKAAYRAVSRDVAPDLVTDQREKELRTRAAAIVNSAYETLIDPVRYQKWRVAKHIEEPSPGSLQVKSAVAGGSLSNFVLSGDARIDALARHFLELTDELLAANAWNLLPIDALSSSLKNHPEVIALPAVQNATRRILTATLRVEDPAARFRTAYETLVKRHRLPPENFHEAIVEGAVFALTSAQLDKTGVKAVKDLGETLAFLIPGVLKDERILAALSQFIAKACREKNGVSNAKKISTAFDASAQLPAMLGAAIARMHAEEGRNVRLLDILNALPDAAAVCAIPEVRKRLPIVACSVRVAQGALGRAASSRIGYETIPRVLPLIGDKPQFMLEVAVYSMVRCLKVAGVDFDREKLRALLDATSPDWEERVASDESFASAIRERIIKIGRGASDATNLSQISMLGKSAMRTKFLEITKETLRKEIFPVPATETHREALRTILQEIHEFDSDIEFLREVEAHLGALPVLHGSRRSRAGKKG